MSVISHIEATRDSFEFEWGDFEPVVLMEEDGKYKINNLYATKMQQYLKYFFFFFQRPLRQTFT